MKLSRTVGYALQSVMQLADAEPNTPIPCNRIASDGKMPERFLLQILRNLVTHRILQSTRGVDGGYALRRSLSEISLLEVIEAVDGPLEPQHSFATGLSDETLRHLSTVLQQVTTTLRQQLDGIKLSQLCAGRACQT
ncbi:MAG: Rrf2 family transcriptional regulator [Pirellulales bacterium]|nr:Rrf2 family transcriptional regulator [Pirellulales bacterium]